MDIDTLKKTEEAILEILGNLYDLPREIANMVCNVYFKYFKLYPNESIDDIKSRLGVFDDMLFENSDNPFTIVRLNIDSLDDTRKNASREAIVAGEFICLSKLIQALRVFKSHPFIISQYGYGYYSMLLDLIDDIFIYKIKGVFDKTPFRRKMERKLKKVKTDLIPNLVDLIDVYFEEEDDDDNDL